MKEKEQSDLLDMSNATFLTAVTYTFSHLLVQFHMSVVMVLHSVTDSYCVLETESMLQYCWSTALLML